MNYAKDINSLQRHRRWQKTSNSDKISDRNNFY